MNPINSMQPQQVFFRKVRPVQFFSSTNNHKFIHELSQELTTTKPSRKKNSECSMLSQYETRQQLVTMTTIQRWLPIANRAKGSSDHRANKNYIKDESQTWGVFIMSENAEKITIQWIYTLDLPHYPFYVKFHCFYLMHTNTLIQLNPDVSDWLKNRRGKGQDISRCQTVYKTTNCHLTSRY